MIQSIKTTSKSTDPIRTETVINKKYPFDYTFTGAPSGSEALGIKNLQDLHIVNAVVEECVIKQDRDLFNQISNPRVISGNVNTYKATAPYQDRVLRLETAVPIPLAGFGAGTSLNANSFTSNAVYKPFLNFLSYDVEGNILSQSKADDIVNSFIWGYENRYLIAEIKNSGLGIAACTSFENGDNEGGWTFTLVASNENKTGDKAHILNNNPVSCSGLSVSVEYIVSYWAKGGTPLLSGGVQSNKDAADTGADGWKYYEKTISGVNSISLSASEPSVYLDELRLYPVGSSVTTYTYKTLTGTTSVTDANNKSIYYEYDDLGRLAFVRDAERNIVKRYKYHYAGEENYDGQ